MILMVSRTILLPAALAMLLAGAASAADVTFPKPPAPPPPPPTADDCHKTLAMLQSAQQLDDIPIAAGDRLPGVLEECRKTWPRYLGYISCGKKAVSHDELLACARSWKSQLRDLRGRSSESPEAVTTVAAAPPGTASTGVCIYGDRQYSPGAVLIMPGVSGPYHCTAIGGRPGWAPIRRGE